jgi:hypothetical protein
MAPSMAAGPAALQPEAPLIRLLAYQEAVFWCELRYFLILWRRQAGKSYTLACKALDRMMERRNHLCVFVSASIALGAEFVLKEAIVFAEVLEKYRTQALAAGCELSIHETGRERRLPANLDLDGLADLFEHSKLETRIWHDQTSYSRSRVVAPNPTTAVGWTGDVFMDEVGRIPDLKAVCEAVGPIMSRRPEFLWWNSTTPPPDDSHYSFELFYPTVESFPLSAAGNWYVSKTGIDVHRADAWDVHAAGQPLYDLKTGLPQTPEQSRAAAFDKAGWDRNFALKFLQGGSSVVGFGSLARARVMGRGQCLAVSVNEEVAL